MAAPIILVDGVAPPPLGAKANGKKTSGAVVALTLSNPTKFGSVQWKVDARPGCTAVLANANPTYPFSTTVTITGVGSFRVTATGDQNAAGDEVAQATIYVPTVAYELRKPSIGETTEFDSANEWDDALSGVIDIVAGGADDRILTDNPAAGQGALYETKSANVEATGVAATDVAALQAAVTAAARLAPRGAFATNAKVDLVSNRRITFGPGSSLAASIPYVEGHFDSAFVASAGSTVGVPWATTTTLDGAAVEGSRTAKVASVAGIAVDDHLVIQGGASAAHLGYQVRGFGVTGTADVTAGALYGGGGTLDGLTIKLNVAGAGETTLTLNGATNSATLAAMLAAILVKWPSLQVASTGPGPLPSATKLVLTASSLVVGSGTANTALGISTTNNTIEVDIPIAYTFPTGANVKKIAPQKDVVLDLGGGTLSGTGGRATWMLGCWDSEIRNGHCRSSFTSYAINHDEAGRRNVQRRLTATYVTGAALVGFSHENGENGGHDECSAYGFNLGFMLAGKGMWADNCRAARGATGFAFQQQDVDDLWGARFLRLTGCEAEGNSGNGFQLSDVTFGATLTACHSNFNGAGGFVCATTTAETTHVGCTARGNAQSGFTAQGTAQTYQACIADNNGVSGFIAQNSAVRPSWIGCSSLNNKGSAADTLGNGFHVVDAGTTGALVSGCNSGGNNGRGIYATGDVTVVGYSSVEDVTGGLYAAGAAKCTFTGCHLEKTTNGNWTALQAASTATMRLTHSDIVMGGTGTKIGIICSSGTTYIEYVSFTGGTYSVYIEAAGTHALRIGPGCNFGTGGYIEVGTDVQMVQTGGVLSDTASHNLTLNEHYCTAIEMGAAAGGDATFKTNGFKGQTYMCRNLSAHNMILTTWTDAGVTVTIAAGKAAIVTVGNDGKMYRVTADT